MKAEERLSTIRFVVDDQTHIHVNTDICLKCSHHNCVYCCPAECFTLTEDCINFLYHGCLECGACRIVCDLGAVDWSYPRGNFGVAYCYG